MKNMRIGLSIPLYLKGMLFSMALLPYDRFEEGFQIIREHMNPIIEVVPNAASFLTYMLRNWNKPETSVFDSSWRTNNYIESTNKYLKTRFGGRPNFWVFLGKSFNKFLCSYNNMALGMFIREHRYLEHDELE